MTPRSPASESGKTPRPIHASIDSVIATGTGEDSTASTVEGRLFVDRLQAQNSPLPPPNSIEHHSSPGHNHEVSSELLWPDSMQIDSSPKSTTSPMVFEGVLHGGNHWSPSQWNLELSISLPQTPQIESTTPSMYQTPRTPHNTVSPIVETALSKERSQSAGSIIGAEELEAMQVLIYSTGQTLENITQTGK